MTNLSDKPLDRAVDIPFAVSFVDNTRSVLVCGEYIGLVRLGR